MCHTAPAAFLFITLISVLLSLRLQLQLTLSFITKFFLFLEPLSPHCDDGSEESTAQSGVSVCVRGPDHGTLTVQDMSRAELKGCRFSSGSSAS